MAEQIWQFYDFISESGVNFIQKWYEKELSIDAQLIFNDILKTDCKTEIPSQWIGFRKFLKGKKFQEDKIWELSFLSDKKQYRVLSVFGPERKQVVFLVGCYHKNKVYTPHNALETAPKRAKMLLDGRGEIHERKIRFDI